MEWDVGITKHTSWNHTGTGWLCAKKWFCAVHLLWERAFQGDSNLLLGRSI